MGLRNLVIPTALVKISGSDGFAVRGLSLNDGLNLYTRHAGELSALFDKFTSRTRDVEQTEVGDVVMNLVSGTPRIMSEIIALAADASPDQDTWDEDVEKVLRFPAAVQMDALQKIGDLTFTSDMPLPKFLGLVLEMATSATAALKRPPA